MNLPILPKKYFTDFSVNFFSVKIGKSVKIYSFFLQKNMLFIRVFRRFFYFFLTHAYLNGEKHETPIQQTLIGNLWLETWTLV